MIPYSPLCQFRQLSKKKKKFQAFWHNSKATEENPVRDVTIYWESQVLRMTKYNNGTNKNNWIMLREMNTEKKITMQ